MRLAAQKSKNTIILRYVLQTPRNMYLQSDILWYVTIDHTSDSVFFGAQLKMGKSVSSSNHYSARANIRKPFRNE